MIRTHTELEAVQRSIARGRPLGDSHWTERTATRLDLTQTLRPRGRSKKSKPE